MAARESEAVFEGRASAVAVRLAQPNPACSRRTSDHPARKRFRVPQLFERASGSWCNPKFDSLELERACVERCLPQVQRRFRYALIYVLTACIVRGMVCVAIKEGRAAFLVPIVLFTILCAGLLGVTYSPIYKHHWVRMVVGLLLALGLGVLSLATAGGTWCSFDENLSQVGSFAICVEVLLLLYAVIPLPLYLCTILGFVYSFAFETFQLLRMSKWKVEFSSKVVLMTIANLLLHACIHAIGMHAFLMAQVRVCNTFLKVGQAIIHGKELEVEKALKEKMIHAVMPQMIAHELLNQQGEEEGGEVMVVSPATRNKKKKKFSIAKEQLPFRPFTMRQMENVSILFADIVGFTRMSANKSADTLVRLLNNLFGRFDKLCELTGCEKISTLGDCYYCVAGCPEPRSDHASCCIEMGLGMIAAIEKFCWENDETVNMRVGVHTGTVLCGILGMKRFKFDVLSNDVNLANMMEQLGVAGKVHVSEATANCITDDRYLREYGRLSERLGPTVACFEQLKGMRTFLISGYMSGERPVWWRDEGPAALPFGGCLLYPWAHPLPNTQVSSVKQSSDGTQQDGMVPNEARPVAHAGSDGTSSTHEASRTARAEGAGVVDLTRGRPGGDKVGKIALPSVKEEEEVEEIQKDEMGQNGQKERRKEMSSSWQGNPKTQNGMLAVRADRRLSTSRSSLVESLQERLAKERAPLLPITIGYKQIMQKSDMHFVEVIKNDWLMDDYFFKPPINKISLSFLKPDLEKTYQASYQEEVMNGAAVDTIANARLSSLLDVFISCVVSLLGAVACLLILWGLDGSTPLPIIATSLVFILHAICLFLSFRMTLCLEYAALWLRKLLEFGSGWIPRHILGLLLVSSPAILTLCNFSCGVLASKPARLFFACAMIVGMTHFCNFCQLSSWFRSILASIFGLLLLLLLVLSLCPPEQVQVSSGNESLVNGSGTNEKQVFQQKTTEKDDSSKQKAWELGLDLGLLLLLIWFLDREFEIAYRLNYHGNVEAELHQQKIEHTKNQADALLHNIIPPHVAEQLKVQPQYSCNHDSVGVIFASIVNFREFYEEKFEGGKECYRVLHELMSDLDQLLSHPDFTCIEKIKTIGATYMAASGLDLPETSRSSSGAVATANSGNGVDGPYLHLRRLFEFACAMMHVVEDFNKDMLWFGFQLRIGYNHGPLTAGVIGTTKPLYDIWGDTVNIASRMDSTGLESRIQVSEESYLILGEMGYRFEYRGTVNVKGKGQMKTYLYPCRDEAPIQPTLPVTNVYHAQVDGSIGRSPADENGEIASTSTQFASDKLVDNSELKGSEPSENLSDGVAAPDASSTALLTSPVSEASGLLPIAVGTNGQYEMQRTTQGSQDTGLESQGSVDSRHQDDASNEPAKTSPRNPV
uniref:adenylate cyclase type 9 isoform X2 n=1 Tax=Myxine glutinosa TaxID=7769 RepID=UPI00358E61EC